MDDNLIEGPEEFELNLVNEAGLISIDPSSPFSTTTIEILDDDDPDE